MKILLIEDEPKVAWIIEQGLLKQGHAVEIASEGRAGLALAREGSYDVIILDVMLPGKSGIEVASELRSEGDPTPILMLTGKVSTDDIVVGLDAGADDYLTKPFELKELLARLRALERRSGDGGRVLRFADIELDQVSHEVTRAGVAVKLTRTEFGLLASLMSSPGKVVSRRELLERVWGIGFDPGTRLVDVHMAHLRKKLEAEGRSRVIATVRGEGFKLCENANC